MKFNKGPKIAVHLIMKDGFLSSSHLSLSDQFMCTGANEKLLEWIALYAEKKPYLLFREGLNNRELSKEAPQILRPKRASFISDKSSIRDSQSGRKPTQDETDFSLTSSIPLSSGTPFQHKVMKALSEIPFGHTVSYQELATLCGSPRGARAVGNACGRNPFPLFIPCHRVIQHNGKLGGFALDLEIKKRLLEFEG